MQDLGAITGISDTSEATSINDSGVITGTFYENGTFAFIFERLEYVDRELRPAADERRVD